MAGTPIPVPELGVTIQQPRIKDIALMGEADFFKGINLLSVKVESYEKMVESNRNLSPEEKEAVKNELMFMTNFQLLLNTLKSEPSLKLVLQNFFLMLFPTCKKVSIDESLIIISWLDDTPELIITDREFDIVAEIVPALFTSESMGQEGFNPANDKAAQIAAKIQARRDKVAKEQGRDKKEQSPIGTAVSVLATSDGLSINEVLNYTLPQIYHQIDRSGKLHDFKSQMTLGAFGGLKDIEISNWKEPI